MDAYTANYLTDATSRTLKKYKAQHETFHIPFETSLFTDTEVNFLQMFEFELIKVNQEQFE